jgi:excisionase family DNA binding protein
MASGSSPPLREPLLTANEVSALLGGIPPKTVLQYARDGRLPCLRIGKHVRFLRSDIGEAIHALRSTDARFRPSWR